jgi:2'-5' RNA ligase
MITHYKEDIQTWEPWQRDYRFGVVLIFPPDPPRAEVNALRAKHDPRSHATCEAHISLTIPLPRPLTADLFQELQEIAREFQPFPIQYGPLMNYLPHPGVVLTIEPQDQLDRLRGALEAAQAFEGAPPRPYPFSAHMTIAEFISVEQTETLMRELADSAPQGSFVCKGVTYAVPDPNFHFTERRQLRFGR